MPKKETPENDSERPLEERLAEHFAEIFKSKTVTAIDFDVMALVGLTASIYILNPQKVTGAFTGFLTTSMENIAQMVGSPIEGAGDALGDFWKWITGEE
jgi:hypothetical protein